MQHPNRNSISDRDKFMAAYSEADLMYYELLGFEEDDITRSTRNGDVFPSYFLIDCQLKIAKRCGGLTNLRPYTIEQVKQFRNLSEYHIRFKNDSTLTLGVDSISPTNIVFAFVKF
jgi:hypothetical protein